MEGASPSYRTLVTRNTEANARSVSPLSTPRSATEPRPSKARLTPTLTMLSTASLCVSFQSHSFNSKRAANHSTLQASHKNTRNHGTHGTHASAAATNVAAPIAPGPIAGPSA